MTKIFYILIFLSLSRQVLGQTFKQYKQTQFQFISSDKKLKGQITKKAYVKKGDTILILSKVDLNKFLALFENTPSSFDSLFENLPWIGYKHSTTDKFDIVLKQTKYKVHADIGTVTIVENSEEIIWNIDHSSYVIASPSCYSSIIFKLKNKATDKTKIDNLEYVKVILRYCDI